MTAWHVIAALAGLALMGASPVGAAHLAPVQIEVQNLRDGRGHVSVALCTEKTFLGEHCPYVVRASARAGSVLVVLPSVPPGTYAVQAFHDDDDSGKLERPMIGFPRKGIGFSRDAPIRFGPPRFTDAAFPVSPAGGHTEVPVRYR